MRKGGEGSVVANSSNMEENPKCIVSKRRLIPKYDDPFESAKHIGNVSYKLKLLERLKLHPIFHVSFLKPYRHDPSPDIVQAK